MAQDGRGQANGTHESRQANGKGEAVLHRPIGLLAELTHRCPLGCPYCSNPLALDPRDGELDTETWARVFGEAATLGVLQVHLSGGEPGARRDLVEITAAAHSSGLYTNLITSAVGITAVTLAKLAKLVSITCKFQFRTTNLSQRTILPIIRAHSRAKKRWLRRSSI